MASNCVPFDVAVALIIREFTGWAVPCSQQSEAFPLSAVALDLDDALDAHVKALVPDRVSANLQAGQSQPLDGS
jgi:hypothetical protein